MKPGPLRIFESVRRAGKIGISSDRLVAILYDDDPNGGPENAKNVLSVRIVFLNKQLVMVKKRIRAPVGRGGPHNYVLEDIK